MLTVRTLLFPFLFLLPNLVVAQTWPPAPRLAEVSIRKNAKKVVMPEYPEESIKLGSKGLAVVQLLYDETGVVTHVKVLEAPDTYIKEAVTAAVRQWTFEPSHARTPNGPLIKIQGKLTFYFVINDRGEAKVENPKQFKEGAPIPRT
jgi:TonB family protein